MKRNIVIFAVLVSVMNVFAQDKNVRNTGPYEFYLAGQYNLSGVKGGGFGLGFDKFFPLGKICDIGFGAQANQSFTAEYGSMTDAYLTGGVRIGNNVGVTAKVIAGVGALPYEDISSNGVDRAVYHGVATRPLGGGGLELFGWLGNTKVSLGVNYLYCFNPGNREYHEADGWTHEPTTFHQSKLQAEVKLSHTLGGGQVSGDADWRIQPSVGQVMGENKGTRIAVDFYHNKRFAHSWRRVLGGGFGQIFGSGTSYNEVYGKVGLQWEPKGAESSVLFNFGVMPGMTEMKKYEAASSEGGYYMTGSVQAPALMVKLYGEIEVPFKKRSSWRFIIGGQYGEIIGFHTTYNYSSTTSGKVRGTGTAYVSIAKAL